MNYRRARKWHIAAGVALRVALPAAVAALIALLTYLGVDEHCAEQVAAVLRKL